MLFPARVLHAGFETALLFLVADLEPDLNELDARVHNVLLRLRAQFEKIPVLLVRAEAHDVLPPGAIVPTPVENHDFARRGEMLHVTLDVHLRLLAVGGSGQCHQPEHARTDPFGDGFDGAALAGSVPALEDYDRTKTLVLDPLLQRAQLPLEFAQLLHVFLVLQFLSAVGFGSLAHNHSGRARFALLSDGLDLCAWLIELFRLVFWRSEM